MGTTGRIVQEFKIGQRDVPAAWRAPAWSWVQQEESAAAAADTSADTWACIEARTTAGMDCCLKMTHDHIDVCSFTQLLWHS